jgi:hypothetical protein
MNKDIKMNTERSVVCRGIRHFSADVLIILTAFLIVSGCAQNFGRYQLSSEVRQAFTSYRVLPDYKYYYAGREHRPDAILGIHRDYTLDNDLWSKIDLTSAQLRDWSSSRQMAYGYYILDPAGKRIGIWYSRFSGVPVKMEAGNRIVVYALLEPLERDGE